MSDITLKEFFEAQLRAAEELRKKDVKAFHDYVNARAIALELQAKEYERRLEGLNGEQARIAKTQETYISREIWERYLDEDRRWKTRTELAIQEAVPRTEFQNYKETTQAALTLSTGKSQGYEVVRNAFSFVSGIIIAVVAMWTVTKGLR